MSIHYAGTSILTAYEQAEEALLILGEPGAGKSMLLRDLALHLITRAQEDDAHPLPVILPLSSWAVSKLELSDWMVEQLIRIYYVPRKLGQQWINQGQILPLLKDIIATGTDGMQVYTTPIRSREYYTISIPQHDITSYKAHLSIRDVDDLFTSALIEVAALTPRVSEYQEYAKLFHSLDKLTIPSECWAK